MIAAISQDHCALVPFTLQIVGHRGHSTPRRYAAAPARIAPVTQTSHYAEVLGRMARKPLPTRRSRALPLLFEPAEGEGARLGIGQITSQTSSSEFGAAKPSSTTKVPRRALPRPISVGAFLGPRKTELTLIILTLIILEKQN
jgi:hypothetical protein